MLLSSLGTRAFGGVSSGGLQMASADDDGRSEVLRGSISGKSSAALSAALPSTEGFRLPVGSFSAGTLENGRFLTPVLLDVKAWRQSSLNVCDSWDLGKPRLHAGQLNSRLSTLACLHSPTTLLCLTSCFSRRQRQPLHFLQASVSRLDAADVGGACGACDGVCACSASEVSTATEG